MTTAAADIISLRNATRNPASASAAPNNNNAPEYAGQAQIIVEGARSSFDGVLVGWNGAGTLTRAALAASLDAHGLPAEWMPRSKSATAYLGNAITSTKRSYVFRNLPAGKFAKNADGEKVRSHKSRWACVKLNTQGAIGDSAGNYGLLIDLRDDSDELHIQYATGDEEMLALGQTIRAEYSRLRGEETYTAADVTAWMRSILISKCHAARYSVGYYVPRAHADTATALMSAIASTQWGSDITDPPLPIVGSTALARGIARNFHAEVKAVADDLANCRETATQRGEAEISTRVAARLLGELQIINDRALAYRALCGDAELADTRALLAQLSATLRAINTDAAVRFGLLELDSEPVAASVVNAVSGSERVAAALADRRAEIGAGASESPWYLQADGVPPGLTVSADDYRASLA